MHIGACIHFGWKWKIQRSRHHSTNNSENNNYWLSVGMEICTKTWCIFGWGGNVTSNCRETSVGTWASRPEGQARLLSSISASASPNFINPPLPHQRFLNFKASLIITKISIFHPRFSTSLSPLIDIPSIVLSALLDETGTNYSFNVFLLQDIRPFSVCMEQTKKWRLWPFSTISLHQESML